MRVEIMITLAHINEMIDHLKKEFIFASRKNQQVIKLAWIGLMRQLDKITDEKNKLTDREQQAIIITQSNLINLGTELGAKNEKTTVH